jgi:hypothetical protein
MVQYLTFAMSRPGWAKNFAPDENAVWGATERNPELWIMFHCSQYPPRAERRLRRPEWPVPAQLLELDKTIVLVPIPYAAWRQRVAGRGEAVVLPNCAVAPRLVFVSPFLPLA